MIDTSAHVSSNNVAVNRARNCGTLLCKQLKGQANLTPDS